CGPTQGPRHLHLDEGRGQQRDARLGAEPRHQVSGGPLHPDELYDGGRVEIDHQLSSARAWEMTAAVSTSGSPMTGGMGGGPPAVAATARPSATRRSSTPSADATGTTLATGRPRSVTSITFPSLTRSMT